MRSFSWRPVGKTVAAALAAALFTGVQASAAVIDGANIPSEGLTLRALQDTPTGFGNAGGGDQGSPGGSELNALYGDIDGGTLKLGITGNLEGNFNKMFIFFDAVAGGEATLANDNADGGFGEINNLAGLSFGGATMDHGIRLEIGGGFYGLNQFDLIDNTAGSITSGGGPGDLPLANVVGAFGTTVGWDNTNGAGVTDTDGTTAATATTGWEFEIDMASFFGEVPAGVRVSALIANGGADFLSNQVLPGAGGAGNLGSPGGVVLGSALIGIPEPTTAVLAALGLLAAARRRV